jgi:hypothetical protein
VRVLPPSTGKGEEAEGAIRPTLLKAWARGVHGARKHLLLVTAAVPRELLSEDKNAPVRLRYLTIAKESGFVSSAAAAGPSPAAEQAATGGGGGAVVAAPSNHNNNNKKGGKKGKGRR